MVVLQTERLLIRDHMPEDLNSMHRLLSDGTAMYYLQDIKTNNLNETAENLNEAISQANLNDRKKYFFAILLKETGSYVGEIGFTVILDTPQGKIVNLGYFTLPDYWGKGIVAEAADEVTRFAFEDTGVLKIETGCIKNNMASERVMQKIGMHKEADFKMHVWHDNMLKDRVEYGLLKEDWSISKRPSSIGTSE